MWQGGTCNLYDLALALGMFRSMGLGHHGVLLLWRDAPITSPPFQIVMYVDAH